MVENRLQEIIWQWMEMDVILVLFFLVFKKNSLYSPYHIVRMSNIELMNKIHVSEELRASRPVPNQ